MASHVSGRPGLQETGAELDRESVATTLFSSHSKGQRYRDTNVVHSLREKENPQKILERKVDSAVRGERERLSKNCTKLRLTLRREIGKREILTLLSEDQSRI